MAHQSLFSVGLSAARFRPMVFRVSAAALGVALVALPALPSWPQSMSLDSVDVAHSQSLDDVEQATSGTPISSIAQKWRKRGMRSSYRIVSSPTI